MPVPAGIIMRLPARLLYPICSTPSQGRNIESYNRYGGVPSMGRLTIETDDAEAAHRTIVYPYRRTVCTSTQQRPDTIGHKRLWHRRTTVLIWSGGETGTDNQPCTEMEPHTVDDYFRRRMGIVYAPQEYACVPEEQGIGMHKQ